jgi:LPXTG-site transpeptidase (sortase) family protein
MNLAATGGEWYQPYIDQAKAKNFLSWREKNWSPGMVLTRGQLIDIVYRAHMVRTQNLVAFTGDPQPAPPPQAVAYGPGSTIAYEAVPGRQYISGPTRQYASSPTARTYQATPTRGTTYATTTPTAPATTSFSISIPALGISAMTVTHPSDPTSQQGLLSVLKYGVGHLYGLPGGNSKILIYGHSSSYSYDTSAYTKIFRTINQLKPGDRVSLTYNGKQFNYEVTGQRQIRPDDTSAFSGAGEELILYTCWPPDRIDTRLLVTARPIR